MIVELHLIQNIAPANLNRDDTGSPKDCTFGGVRRARISSQALKRAARRGFTAAGLDPSEVGVRTRKAAAEITRRLVERHGREPETARTAAENALANLGLDQGKAGSEYLLYLSVAALDRFADRCNELFDRLTGSEKPKKGEIKELQKEELFAAPRAVDIALFGRMVADLPDQNVDAASQVAHAISTHEVRPEFDYFTAVDDLQEADESGAGHIDTLEFNSACHYRYAAVDTRQLVENLGGDRELAARGLRAFLHAMIRELPTGKQNSMAAHNPPSLVLTTVREAGQWNLANAFEDPVRPRDGLVGESVSRLLRYYERLTAVYEHLAPAAAHLVAVDDLTNVPEGIAVEPSVTALVDATVSEAFDGDAA